MNKYNSEEKNKNSDELLHTNVTNTFVSYIDSRKRLGLEEKRRPPENYLLSSFILVKIAYTINSFAQLYILNRFLCSNDSLMFGSELFNSIGHTYIWLFELELFPTLTKCHLLDVDFDINQTVKFLLRFSLF